MDPTGQESFPLAIPLSLRVAPDPDATQIADALAATLRELEAALVPIVGQRGVAALYTRSLFVTGRVHLWLSPAADASRAATDFATLRGVIAAQPPAGAAAGASAVLQTLHDLLAALIGPALTEQLLGAVWANTFSGPAAQDLAS